eukprot:gene11067-11223_t
MRAEATHAQFTGRLLLGLLLGLEPPGVRGIYYSFATPPKLDIAVRPLGVALPPEFLGLGRALTALLQRIINRRLVEPQRRFFDLQRMYTNKHVARAGGPGGLLRVVILSAKHLNLVDEAVWNWQFSLALPADLASSGVPASAQNGSTCPASQTPQQQQDVLRLSVYDAQTVGEPALLGSCKADRQQASSALEVLYAVPVDNIISIQDGRRLPLQTSQGAADVAKLDHGREAAAGQWLTVVAHHRPPGASASASEGAMLCLQLQLPALGNGRSRDEWLHALNDLLAEHRGIRSTGHATPVPGPPSRGRGKASGCPSPLSSTSQSRAGSFAALQPPASGGGAPAAGKEGQQDGIAGTMEALDSVRAQSVSKGNGCATAAVAVPLQQTTDQQGHQDAG